MKYLKSLFYSLIFSYLPCILIAVLFLIKGDQTMFAQEAAAVFLLSFPFFVAFIVLGAFIGGLLNKQEISKGEILINILSDVAACVIIIIGLINLSQRMYISIVLSALLIALWIVKAIIYKRKPELFEIIKTKLLWIMTASVIIVFTLIAFLVSR